MNMTSEEERDALIDRYVNHKLTAEEEADLEVRMMDDSELFERAQLAEALKQGLETQSSSPKAFLPFRLWFYEPLSLAASITIVALGLHAIYTNLLTPASSEGALLAVDSAIMLEGARGNSPLRLSGPPPYLFQIDVGLGNQADSYSVTVRNASTNTALFNMKDLHAGTDGWIRLVINQVLTEELQVELEWLDQQGANQTRNFVIEVTE